MLRSRFWKGLRSERLRNATRVHYEMVLDYEALRRAVRSEEYEQRLSSKSAQDQPKEVDNITEESKLDLMMRKIQDLEKQMQRFNRGGYGKRVYQQKEQKPKENQETTQKSLN